MRREKKEKVAVGRIFEPTGEVISKGFNAVWGGHAFTEEEIALLLMGRELKVQTQNDKIIIGRLEKGSYKKHKFWGFQIGIPESTAGHEWSEEEREALYNGKELVISDFYSPASCENFTATAAWDYAERRILLFFDDEDNEDEEDENIEE